MDKIWKPLVYKGLDFTKDFLVSNYGEIYSLRTKKILHQSLNKSNCLSEYFKKSSRKTAGKHPVTGEPLIWEIVE